MRLDELSREKGLSKKQRAKLSDMIASLALETGVADDPELKDVYNRHSGSDFDRDEAAGIEEIKAMMKDTLGIDLGDDFDPGEPGALESLFAQLDGAGAPRQEYIRPHRPKSSAAAAREQRLAEEAKRLQQSLREIFRKLASQLHPDREPDPAESLRKNGLMQRALGSVPTLLYELIRKTGLAATILAIIKVGLIGQFWRIAPTVIQRFPIIGNAQRRCATRHGWSIPGVSAHIDIRADPIVAYGHSYSA